MTKFLEVGEPFPDGGLAEVVVPINLAEGKLELRPDVARHVWANGKSQDIYAYLKRGSLPFKNRTLYWEITSGAAVTPVSGNCTSDESGRTKVSLTPVEAMFPPAALTPVKIQYYMDDTKNKTVGDVLEYGVLPPVNFTLEAKKEGFLFTPFEAKTFEDGTCAAGGTFTLNYSDPELARDLPVNEVFVQPGKWGPGAPSGMDGSFLIKPPSLGEVYSKYGVDPKTWKVPTETKLTDEAKQAIPDYRERVRYSLTHHWNPIGVPGPGVEKLLGVYDEVYLRQLCEKDAAAKAIGGTYLLGATVSHSNVWNISYETMRKRAWMDVVNLEATLVGLVINTISTDRFGIEIADWLAKITGKLTSVLTAVPSGAWWAAVRGLEKVVHYVGRFVNGLAGLVSKIGLTSGPWSTWAGDWATKFMTEFLKTKSYLDEVIKGNLDYVGFLLRSLASVLGWAVSKIGQFFLWAFSSGIAPCIRLAGRAISEIYRRTPLASFLENEALGPSRLRQAIAKEMGKDCGLFLGVSKFFDVWANLVSNYFLEYFWNANANPDNYKAGDPSLWAGFLKTTMMTASAEAWMKWNHDSFSELHCSPNYKPVIQSLSDSGDSVRQWTDVYSSMAGTYDTWAGYLDKAILAGEMLVFAFATLSSFGVGGVVAGSAITVFEITVGKWKLALKDGPLLVLDAAFMGGILAHYYGNMSYLVQE